jgi:site-specific recombinase XerD
MKLSKAIQGFLLFKRVSLSESTLYRVRRRSGKTAKILPGRPRHKHPDLRKFERVPHLLAGYPQEIKKGIAARDAVILSGKSRRNIHTVMASFWTWAVDAGIARQHLMRRVPRPKAEKRAIETLTRDDVIALLKACESYHYERNGKTITAPRQTALRDKAIIKILLDTGLRVSELCAARIADFDARNHRLKVMGTGSKERILSMDVRTTQAVWMYLETQRDEAAPGDPLFVNHGETTPMTRRNLLTLLKRAGEAAGVPGVHPHQFRHTFAINFLRNGGNIFALQEMLGHASLDMCKRYLAIAQADVETAHRKASPVANWRL